jgi:cobalt/nickel transport system permease protein
MIPALAHVSDPAPRPASARRSLARRTADSINGAMMEVLENDETASLPGLLQRLDPRVKLASILLFAVTVSFLQSIYALVLMIAFTVGVAAASRVSSVSFARKVWASAGLFALLIAAPAVTSWITPGIAVLTVGPLTVTAPGLYVAVRLVLRVVAGAGIGLLVVWTTRWTDLLRALTEMRVPDIVVATLAMTQKQIMSLLRTVENIHLARESRMLTVGSARDNRGWVIGRIGFVAAKSMKTADDVYDAMLSRGFTGAMPSLTRLRTTGRDWAWAAAGLTAAALALGLDRVLMPR